LGAGNIGDELMARAFWKALPREVTLEVALFEEAARHREGYPPQHHYHPVDYYAGEGGRYHWPGLLVGTTPVTEGEGRHWPLDFIARRLRVFHQRGLPVDAVGVGVEPLQSEEGRAIFHEAFAPIRSWTVRSEQCRSALLELSVSPDRIRVGADWAWLWEPNEDKREWARETWRMAGVDLERPLLIVNLMNRQWNLAAALDAIADRTGVQVGFWANDCRSGEFFDESAGDELAARMTQPLLRLPNHYYSADEAIALLGCATIALGARYHFLIQSVLGGSVPIALTRGPKIATLADELETPYAGNAALVEAACEETLARHQERREWLGARQAALRERARLNLSFLEEIAPYSGAFARC
jgi:polysaccharide pyruvyl transferase WcaK-like protein